jgi:ketosteroid isomerase-like protein
MSEHENRQFVEQAYATFKAGDIPTLLQSLSEDVTWQLPEIENVPFSGKRQGRGARRRVLFDPRKPAGSTFIR